MKTFLGFLQFVLGIGGLIALFNAEWFLMLLAWGGGLLVGLAGTRMVKATEGVSQGGQEAILDIQRTVEHLQRGEYSSASGSARSAVFMFRTGGDRELLAIALTLYAVAQAATGELPRAYKALDEAAERLSSFRDSFSSEAAELREMHRFLRREFASGVTYPSEFVERFLQVQIQR